MDNVHCGSAKLPKGKRHGTVVECAKKGQIRLYGLKKVDPLFLKKIKMIETQEDKYVKAKRKFVEATVRSKKLVKDFHKSTNKEEKKKIQHQNAFESYQLQTEN